MDKAICYVRSSVAEHQVDGLSIQTQADVILRYCRENALDSILVIRDEDVSGALPLDRRLGGRDLRRILSTAGVHHVVVLKLDRLFRNAGEAFARLQDWKRNGIHLHVVDMGGYAIRTDGEIGACFLGMLSGFADMERHLASERTSAALALKKANRFIYGTTPYGYDLADRQLVPNEAEQEVIRKVKGWRAEGWSLRRIAQTLNEGGVPTKQAGTSGRATRWYASTVRYLLANPLYDAV